MAATGQGATFTFMGHRGFFSGGVTKISVETRVAEVADLTGTFDAGDVSILVPTGAWKGGSINVEFVASPTLGDVQSIVRGVGVLTFSSAGYSVSKRVILESASSGVAVGDIVKGTLRFVQTDHTGF